MAPGWTGSAFAVALWLAVSGTVLDPSSHLPSRFEQLQPLAVKQRSLRKVRVHSQLTITTSLALAPRASFSSAL